MSTKTEKKVNNSVDIKQNTDMATTTSNEEETNTKIYEVGTTNWALAILEQAVNVGQSHGAYTIGDSVLINDALNIVKTLYV